VIEHRSLLELSLSIEKSLSCVIEQLVIRHYILVKLSLEVQGGHDYFRFVEGTCIIACVLSFSILLLLSAALTLWTQVRLWTTSDSESGNSFSERKKEKFLNTQFNPPFLWFFSPSATNPAVLIRSGTKNHDTVPNIPTFPQSPTSSTYFLHTYFVFTYIQSNAHTTCTLFAAYWQLYPY